VKREKLKVKSEKLKVKNERGFGNGRMSGVVENYAERGKN
jgi:hypothetical protein